MTFVDTGAFLARHLVLDQHHAAAISGWEKLYTAREPCITSNFVLDETFTLLARRAGYAFAADRARNIYDSAVLTIHRPSQEDELSALDFLEKFADQEVSFTDCISFVLMRKSRTQRVFTFDRHFKLAGFKIWP